MPGLYPIDAQDAQVLRCMYRWLCEDVESILLHNPLREFRTTDKIGGPDAPWGTTEISDFDGHSLAHRLFEQYRDKYLEAALSCDKIDRDRPVRAIYKEVLFAELGRPAMLSLYKLEQSGLARRSIHTPVCSGAWKLPSGDVIAMICYDFIDVSKKDGPWQWFYEWVYGPATKDDEVRYQIREGPYLLRKGSAEYVYRGSAANLTFGAFDSEHPCATFELTHAGVVEAQKYEFHPKYPKVRRKSGRLPRARHTAKETVKQIMGHMVAHPDKSQKEVAEAIGISEARISQLMRKCPCLASCRDELRRQKRKAGQSRTPYKPGMADRRRDEPETVDDDEMTNESE